MAGGRDLRVGDFTWYWDSEMELSYLCRVVELDYHNRYATVDVHDGYGHLTRGVDAMLRDIDEDPYTPTEKEILKWLEAELAT